MCHEHANDHDIIAAYEIIKQAVASILRERNRDRRPPARPKSAFSEEQPEPIVENYELERLEERAYRRSCDELPSVISPLSNDTIATNMGEVGGSWWRSDSCCRRKRRHFSLSIRLIAVVAAAEAAASRRPANRTLVAAPAKRSPKSAAFSFEWSAIRRQVATEDRRKLASTTQNYNPKIQRPLNLRRMHTQDLHRDRALR